jgi:hypothetical protein
MRVDWVSVQGSLKQLLGFGLVSTAHAHDGQVVQGANVLRLSGQTLVIASLCRVNLVRSSMPRALLRV